MIHYHGTPCGGEREQAARFLSGRHALIPWVRPEDLATAMEVCQSFMVDNGAFSAWKSGKPIESWGGYFQWAVTASRHPGFDFAVIPDVIDGTEHENDELIAEWCAAVYRRDIGAPVWHLHESLDRLDRLCAQWSRVCLGSSGAFAQVATRRWWERISEAMGAACDAEGRPRCKLHGLRMLDPEVFCVLPLASADSTNAVRNGSSTGRFGMYPSPNQSTRMAVIAERIEAHQSVGVYRKQGQESRWLFRLEADGVR